VRGETTTEPPAHCRLVSGHDLFQDRASLNSTRTHTKAALLRRGIGEWYTAVMDELAEILERVATWPEELRWRAIDLLNALESGEADDWRLDDEPATNLRAGR